ncbi:23S rRNA (adenine(2503)-C(2))-methyltransferase RlmN [Clostridiaceae bacterium NSJ-31]|uniref:Probable dual-specificity RNA methyltransferase RlmN n=1 Tax=Ligaoa zhengdingensis TaxID=2763658 RepID=A0A926E0I5_9FIRM|nr:23S rRNA (adenine(2503)-C(2))-methyltransferase RlmN [Ligaoa zhengdingensis]
MSDAIDLKSLTLPKLEALMAEWGQPRFRAGQLFEWMHQKQVGAFDEMTNLPAALRRTLGERCTLSVLTVRRRLVSRLDGTQKFLFGLPDGETVECVLMKYKHGNSLCISTQVGCKMGCRFCASTLLGLSRNLTPGEMLEEVYAAQRESGERVGSIVLMGIGEPLDNFDNVMDFLEILSSPRGMNLSLRHVSLSTCGLVPRIYDLMERKTQVTLSISLHAPNNALRDKLMPVNRRYPVEELMKACRDYFAHTGRRVSYEYSLIGGVNDTEECARELAALLRGQVAHVNLIPINEVKEREFRKGSRARIERFQSILTQNKINATVRRELGADINAACGQLRREERGAQNGC